MSRTKEESGFTIVELLITLFVGVAFLVAGYQLYNVIIKDGGLVRAEAKASNVAYDYLRRYSTSAVSPCVASTPVNNTSITVAGLSAVNVTVTISCPYSGVTAISKINVQLTYNSPQQTVKYSTYVNR